MSLKLDIKEAAVARTVIDIDDVALAGAMHELGTKTKVETVNEALRIVAGSSARIASFQRFTLALDESDFDDAEVMTGAWRT